MVTELLLSLFFKISDLLLGLLPDTDWNIDFDSWHNVSEYLEMVAYLLPMSYIRPLIVVIISVVSLRIGLAVIQLILRLIPFFG